MSEPTLTENIKSRALLLGADLVGIADLNRLQGIPTIPDNLLTGFTRAVVVAIAISPEIFAQIAGEPTPLYSHHYLQVNQMLDTLTFSLQQTLIQSGHRALALPASQVLDTQNWMGHISSKAVAMAAGLGWQGRSLLLITPQFGPRVRIAVILTNAPLMAEQPIPNRCGKCQKCKEACPAGAIRGASWEYHPETREAALDFAKCVDKLTKDFAPRPLIGKPICGVCIKVCPWSSRQGGNTLEHPSGEETIS